VPLPAAGAPLRVAVVAEVCLYREGVAQSLMRRPEAVVTATAGCRADALELLRHGAPQVLLLDLGIAGAGDVIAAARTLAPETRIVALAITESEEGVLACAEAGVAGYLTRDASMDDLLGTLLSVARGELVCPPAIAASLFRHVGTLSARRAEPAPDVLTPREREIAALIRLGMSNKEISRRLSIGLSTVKNHVHNVLEKLHVPRRGAAAARMGVADAHAGAG
jgi:two-component system, NarL family, nitrate/nitrite response regulator NarL